MGVIPGDAATQDMLIANIRRCPPNAEFSGICLNCERFLDRHGVNSFPLAVSDILFHYILRGRIKDLPRGEWPSRNQADTSSNVASKQVMSHNKGIFHNKGTFLDVNAGG